MIRLRDLPPEQKAVLHNLQCERPDMEKLGQEMRKIDSDLVHAVDELAKLKLAEWILGVNGKVWFRLTQRGKTLRDEGSV